MKSGCPCRIRPRWRPPAHAVRPFDCRPPSSTAEGFGLNVLVTQGTRPVAAAPPAPAAAVWGCVV